MIPVIIGSSWSIHVFRSHVGIESRSQVLLGEESITSCTSSQLAGFRSRRWSICCFIRVIMNDEILPNVFDLVLKETRKCIRYDSLDARCYFKGDTTCECGIAPEATKNSLQCPLLSQPYSLDDPLHCSSMEERRNMCVGTYGRSLLDGGPCYEH